MKTYKDLLNPIRRRPSIYKKQNKTEDFYSDRSRVLFSSSFRRMMNKAQVFPLEQNSSIRNRLTHSLEVSDIGRTLSRKITDELIKQELLDTDEAESFITIVETACLLHDIGNPPFGHFGEEAIKIWFTEKGEDFYLKSIGHNDEIIDLSDFKNFDGNPQGFRIVSRLHCEQDEFSLNLTIQTLLSTIKYPKITNEIYNGNYYKKSGLFITEKEIYEEITKNFEIDKGKRFPLSYIMEAADDISYCLSDIADAIEKGIINLEDFKKNFSEICKTKYKKSVLFYEEKEFKNFNLDFCVKLSRSLMNEISEEYFKNHEDYLNGTATEIILKINSNFYLEALKDFARKYIYISQDVLKIEVSGKSIVTGLLDGFGQLLMMKKENFEYFVNEDKLLKNKGLDYEWRLYKLLSKRLVDNYRFQSKGKKGNDEWLLRAHLIVDYISGMTDAFALETYKMLKGIII